jgi:hypothetical protein
MEPEDDNLPLKLVGTTSKLMFYELNYIILKYCQYDAGCNDVTYRCLFAVP